MSDTYKELERYCKSYREELERLYNADYTDEEQERLEEEGEVYDLYSYFNDALDIEYTISARGDFLGCRIAVALGGPNIYIDTRAGEIRGAWGTDRVSVWLPSEICNEIDAIFEDLYNCTK